VWGTHREAIEIKEDSEADLPENQLRFDLIRGLLAEHGYHFRLWRRSEICGEPRLSNASLVLRYRSVRVSAVERESIQLAFSSRSEVRLSMFEGSPMVVRSILHLVLDGALHVDWWKPIDFHARVSVHPIGSRCGRRRPQRCEGTGGGEMSLHALRRGHRVGSVAPSF
jgi:hypothetical protein